MPPKKPVLVLVGPPAAGKTRVGKRVARLLEVGFVDTDAEITRDHGPISEIFSSHGEAAFRVIERDAVIGALAGEGVVALGGGAVISPDTRADLQGHRVVLVTISADAVSHRLDPLRRPLLAGGLPAWLELVSARAQFYDEVSQTSFDTSHRSIDDVAEEIAQWLRGVEQL